MAKHSPATRHSPSWGVSETSPAFIGGTPFESFAITFDYIDCPELEGSYAVTVPLNAAGREADWGERVDGCHMSFFRDPDFPTPKPVNEATILHESAHCWQFFMQRAGTADDELAEFWVTEGFADWYAAQLAQTSAPGDFGFYQDWREGGMMANNGSRGGTELSGLFRSDYHAVGFWTAYESLVGGPESLMGICESVLLDLASLPAYVPITSSIPRELAFDERSAAVLELLDTSAPFSLAFAMATAIAAPGPTFSNGFAWPDGGASETAPNWSLGTPGTWSAPATRTVFLGTGEVLIAALGHRNAGDIWQLEVTPEASLDAVVLTDTDEIEAREIGVDGATWTYVEGAAAECPVGQMLASGAELPVVIAAGTDDHVMLANRSASMVKSTVSWRSATLEEWQAENCITPVFALVRQRASSRPLYNGPLGSVDCGEGLPLECPSVFSSSYSNPTKLGVQSGVATNELSITESQITVTSDSKSEISSLALRSSALSERRTTVRVEAGTDVRFSWDVCASPGFPISAISQVVLNGSPSPSIDVNSSGSTGACSGSSVLTFSTSAQVTLVVWTRSDTFRAGQPSAAYATANGSLTAQIEP